MKYNFDVTIVGAGPVGLFAAFQAGMLGMKSCTIDVLDHLGGQCTALYPDKPIFDIPAYPKIISQDLVKNLIEQADQFNPTYLLSRMVVKSERLADNNGFKLTTSKGDEITSKAIIIAAGAGCFEHKKPPLNDIELFENKSVFYSVDNQNDFQNKNIVIAGGGNSAVDWALELLDIAASITIVHRRKKFSAASSNVQKLEKLQSEGRINVITDFQLAGLEGNNGILEAVILKDLNGNRKSVSADILLPFFGLSQNLGPIKNFGLSIDRHHIQASYPYFETNIPGIYAVGDVVKYEGKLKLILTGFAEVASAVYHSYPRVFDGKPLHFEYSTSKNLL